MPLRLAVIARLVVLCAPIVTAVAAVDGATGGSASYRWAVKLSVHQRTVWRYDWAHTQEIEIDGVPVTCKIEEHGNGAEAFKLRSTRAGGVVLLPLRNGRVVVRSYRTIVLGGLQRRTARFVHAESGADGCRKLRRDSPDDGCGARPRHDRLKVVEAFGRSRFRVVTVRAGRSPKPCPGPPSGSDTERSVVAGGNVSWGRLQALSGRLLPARRIPGAVKMVVRLTYTGSTPYAGRDSQRPEQKGVVITRVRATAVFRRLG